MDPITHGLAGGLAGDVLKSSKKRFLIFCFLGEAPDLDVFLSHLGPWSFIYQHRGLTHSLFGIVLQAILYVLLFSKIDRHDSFLKRIGLYCVPLTLHLLCDYLTSYGVPVFSPFSLANYQADIMTAVNLFPTIIMTIGYVVISRKKHLKPLMVRGMVAGWVFYLLGSIGLRELAKTYNVNDVPATVVATVYNPFVWGLVIPDMNKNEYRCYRINLLKKDFEPALRVPMMATDSLVNVSQSNPLVREFFIGNRWPVARISPDPLGWKVDWGSLLFSKRGMVRGKVRIFFDNNGKLLYAQRYIGFWNPELKRNDEL